MTSCRICGFVNRDRARFCAGCAAALDEQAMPSEHERSLADLASAQTRDTPEPGQRPCGRCGALNQPGSQFCFECGASLSVPSLLDTAASGAPTLTHLPARSPDPPVVTSVEPAGRRGRYVVVVVVAMLLVGGAAGGMSWWLVAGDDDGDDARSGSGATPSTAAPSTRPETTPDVTPSEAARAGTHDTVLVEELESDQPETEPSGTTPPRATEAPVETAASHEPTGRSDDETPHETSPTQPSATTTTATPQRRQPSPREQLDAFLAGDRETVEGLVDHWVPQVSAKRVGIEADGIVYSIDDVLADHERLRDEYGAALLWSGDFNYRSGDLWITVVPESFGTGEAAVGWCVDQGIDADNCFAKLITHDMSLDSTVVYQ